MGLSFRRAWGYNSDSNLRIQCSVVGLSWFSGRSVFAGNYGSFDLAEQFSRVTRFVQGIGLPWHRTGTQEHFELCFEQSYVEAIDK